VSPPTKHEEVGHYFLAAAVYELVVEWETNIRAAGHTVPRKRFGKATCSLELQAVACRPILSRGALSGCASMSFCCPRRGRIYRAGSGADIAAERDRPQSQALVAQGLLLAVCGFVDPDRILGVSCLQ
jgi:hypothetical protein